MSLVIVDTGCANLSSVAFAFERLGVAPTISKDANIIRTAKRVILPGVGAAPYALRNIETAGLRDTLTTLIQPVLGICLGMQILFETLTEGGEKLDGLGLIPGEVEKLDTLTLPSPHMGWNRLDIRQTDPLTKGLTEQDYAYFVHSYAAPVSDKTLAASNHGSEFSAIVRKDNVWGCQFHPERSSQTGAKILKNFMEIST